MTHLLRTEPVALKRLVPYPGNPRRGDIEAIKESLEGNGQYRPIVVRADTLEVLAGNHTLRAASELGWEEIVASFVSCTDEEAKRIVLVDNRTNDLAGYDEEALVALLQELSSLEGTGYEAADLEALLAELSDDALGPDVAPPPPASPRTRPGDLWQLGRHRLLCADARDPEAYARLLGEERPGALWTDPPYGVAYEGKTVERLRIENDGPGELADLLADSFAAIDSALAPGAALYVAHPGGSQSVCFGQAFIAAGWLLRQTLVWVKDTMVLGHSDYHYRHEQVLYGYKPGDGRLGRGGTGWHGDDAQTSAFEVDRPAASREHPTMKPPELIEAMLANSTRAGELVLDPFAGSGSTLVAAERTRRRARLIELDPAYCDVIVSRYETLTGAEAKRERD